MDYLIKTGVFLQVVIIYVPPIILDSGFLTYMLLFWLWYFAMIYENGKIFTWIWVFLLYSWKIEILFLKFEDQELQTMQL